MTTSSKIKIPKDYTYITAFLTKKCNLKCSYCLTDFTDTKNEIDGGEWIKAFNRIDSDLPITLTGGEPMMHKDFIDIINNTDKKIDLLTNFYNKDLVHKFLIKANPKKFERNSPYPSIRVSYHPEQMDADRLVKNVKIAKDFGFNIGIWSVLYPSPEQLSAINKMQFNCKDNGLEFRLKEFTGMHMGQKYGDYSKYPDAIYSIKKNVTCKTKELIIGTNGDVYNCHRDLYKEENMKGNITNPVFKINNKYQNCKNYGDCQPCDVKLKTSHNQNLGYTSVDIK